MPRGRPFKNMAATFQGGGITANSRSEHSAARMRITMAEARFAGFSSEMTLMPMNFDSAYPATWAITSAIL